MFRDRSEELHRLEEALLEEEEYTLQDEAPEEIPEDDDLLTDELLDELLEDTSPVKAAVAYQNFSNDYGKAYNTDTTDVDLDEYCRQVEQPPKKDLFGLVILACLLALGILGMVIYLMLRQGGIL